MRHAVSLLSLLASIGHLASSAVAQSPSVTDEAATSFSAALRGCEACVLEPSTWIDGFEPFVATIGLGDRLHQVKSLPEQLLPPEMARRANRYWRIDLGDSAGFSLVVSDQVPVCHVAGASERDLRPVLAGLLDSPAIRQRWELVAEEYRDGVTSTLLRFRDDERATLLVSRTDRLGSWDEIPQVLATLAYSLEPSANGGD